MSDEPKNAAHVSRRHFIVRSAGAVVAGGALSGCVTKPPFMAGTLSKAEAQYRDSPNGFQKCGMCHHFYSPNMCNVVAGPVSPEGWCTHYEFL